MLGEPGYSRVIDFDVKNGDFETLGAPVFNSWGSSGTVAADTGFTGTNSAKLTSDGANSYVDITQSVLAVGVKYRISFMAKTDVAGRSIRVGADGSTGIKVFTLTTGWTLYTYEFIADNASLIFKRDTLTSASAWIDCVRLLRVA